MPELPEVHLKGRLFSKYARGKRIEKVDILDERMIKNTSPGIFKTALLGHTIHDTTQHGKYLFTALNPGFLILHFGMTGDISFLDPESPLPRFSKVTFTLDDGQRIIYTSIRRLGLVSICEDKDNYIQVHKLGKHILDVDEQTFLSEMKQHQGRIKALLLNQSVWSGIGNLYADESLYQSQIHPLEYTGYITPEKALRLYQALQDVLRISIQLDTDFSRFPAHYLLSDRKGRASCPRCHTLFQKCTAAGRTSVFCPHCQSLSQNR